MNNKCSLYILAERIQQYCVFPDASIYLPKRNNFMELNFYHHVFHANWNIWCVNAAPIWINSFRVITYSSFSFSLWITSYGNGLRFRNRLRRNIERGYVVKLEHLSTCFPGNVLTKRIPNYASVYWYFCLHIIFPSFPSLPKSRQCLISDRVVFRLRPRTIFASPGIVPAAILTVLPSLPKDSEFQYWITKYEISYCRINCYSRFLACNEQIKRLFKPKCRPL